MLSQSILMLGRLAREPAVHTTAALASVPAAAAGLQAVGVNTVVDHLALADGLQSASLWITLGMAALFGGIGGVVAELLSLHGNIELPHRVRRRTTAVKRTRLADPQHEIDLGIVSRIFLGATAGLALLSVYAPESPTGLIANTLIAGSAATGLFRLVQGRMLGREPLAVSRKQLADGAPKTRLSVVEPQSAANS
jgi:hypothetical protein